MTAPSQFVCANISHVRLRFMKPLGTSTLGEGKMKMRRPSIRIASFFAAAALAGSWQVARGQVLFADSFETGTFSGNYDIFASNPAGSPTGSDFSAAYVDYTTLDYEVDDGLGNLLHPDVPANPNGSGTQVLQMKINNTSNQVNS